MEVAMLGSWTSSARGQLVLCVVSALLIHIRRRVWLYVVKAIGLSNSSPYCFSLIDLTQSVVEAIAKISTQLFTLDVFLLILQMFILCYYVHRWPPLNVSLPLLDSTFFCLSLPFSNVCVVVGLGKLCLVVNGNKSLLQVVMNDLSSVYGVFSLAIKFFTSNYY